MRMDGLAQTKLPLQLFQSGGHKNTTQHPLNWKLARPIDKVRQVRSA